MGSIQVALSANAGVCVQIGKRRIWVDALHQQKQDGFSAVSPQLYDAVMKSEAFAAPEFICVTHCHPDHYSREMAEAASRCWSDAALCIPQPEFDEQILVAEERFAVDSDGLVLEFIRLPHEGAQYADVKHYGILIRAEGKTVLIAGDCETASPVLEKALAGSSIDLAILNFPWVTLTKGRAFLTRVLKPKKVLLCHLPFEEDDINGFRGSAQRTAQLLDMDIRLLTEPLQTEIVNI